MNYDQIKIKESQIVKVYFKERDTRLPMIGKFVYLRDAYELKSKNMVRFVGKRFLDNWSDNEPQIALTRIFVVSDFSQVKVVDIATT